MPTLKNSIAASLATALVLSLIGFKAAEARSRRHHSRANAAAVAAVLGVFGTIAALAARDRYRHRDYFYDAPYGPYYGLPYAYYPPRADRYRHRYRRRHWSAASALPKAHIFIIFRHPLTGFRSGSAMVGHG